MLLGRGKKSKFQQEKAARLAKKRKADAEAAEVYAKFVASFDGDEADAPAFVAEGGGRAAGSGSRGGGSGGGGGGSNSGSTPFARPGRGRPKFGSRRRQSDYVPPWERNDKGLLPTPGTPAAAVAASAAADAATASKGPALQNVFGVDDEDVEAEAAKKAQAAAAAKTKGLRIGSFMQMLKKRQEEGASSALPIAPTHGSLDTGDPTTTNLYVGNLAPTVTEELLTRKFGKYGPLLSVKIMWPRNDEERNRARNSGFVAFERRKDAEAAFEALRETEIGGRLIRLQWAKAVRRAGMAGTTSLAVLLPSAKAPPATSTAPSHSAGRAGAGAGVSARRPRSSSVAGSVGLPASDADTIQVRMPLDTVQRQRIDLLARYVAKDKQGLESRVMDKERSNLETKFNFLFEPDSDEGVYYRWRVAAYIMGDDGHRYRMEPFQLTTGGPWWVPPEPLRRRSASLSRSPSRSPSPDRRNTLAPRLSDEFRDMLRDLSLTRAAIRDAMGFALDHAEAAADIVRILSASLVNDSTPAPIKVARLYLVSDILHNSSATVKNASAYRGELQAVLPEAFESLHRTLISISGRMTAAALQAKVMSVLTMWSRVSLFPVAFLSGLEASFKRTRGMEEAAAAEVRATGADGASVTAVDEEELARQCRLAGVSNKGSVFDLQCRCKWAAAYMRQKALSVSLGPSAALVDGVVPNLPDVMPSTADGGAPADGDTPVAADNATGARAPADDAAPHAPGAGFVTMTAEEEEAARVARQAVVNREAAAVMARRAEAATAVAGSGGGDDGGSVEEGEEEEDIDGEPLGSDVDLDAWVPPEDP